MIRLLIAATLFLSVLTAADEAQARGRWWQRRAAARRQRPTHDYDPRQLPPRVRNPGPPGRRDTDDYYRAAYPKYYGGFHSREMQNIGIPSSDGIVETDGMESLDNLERIAREGMRAMEPEILRIMQDKLK